LDAEDIAISAEIKMITPCWWNDDIMLRARKTE